MESDCKRQLFLGLAYAMPEKWFTDDRKIEIPKPIRKRHEFLLIRGKNYEQNVYSRLKLIEGAYFNMDHEGNVDETYINPAMFSHLYDELKKSHVNDFILLEYQFEVPDSFLYYIFEAKEGKHEIPVNYGEQRPDIILIGKSINKLKDDVYELLTDGTKRRVPEKELETRFGVNIIDVKNVREDHIGKKQFIEIFYYLWTFSYFLKENNLDDKFYVRIDYNGIFPQYSDNELLDLQTFDDLNEATIKINWDESLQIFVETINKIRKLWAKAPIPIESTPVNIQQTCGYCFYIEDCKKSLGMDGETETKDWSLKLIPYASSSIAQQLISDHKFQTIGDVAEKINSIRIGNTPNPIYSELPLLRNKALALINDIIVTPKVGHTHSYAIPRFSPISITFAVETDPITEKVYAAGFFLQMYTFANSNYSNVFDNWWKTWKESIIKEEKPNMIQEKLNRFLVKEIKLAEVEGFLYLLNKLKIDERLIHIRGEPAKSGKPRKQTRVILQFATINEGDTNETEASFTRDIIEFLFYILELANDVEKYVIVKGGTTKSGYTYYYGPTTSLFYWSKKQLDNFQDMLERNLIHIIDDLNVWGKFSRIISLFTPTDSEVAPPFQHKKLFNLQEFTETIFGFPNIINYTWHEIAKTVFDINSSKDYWIPHFNYMHTDNWYRMISIQDPGDEERKEIRKEIQRQLMHKIRTINNIRVRYQIESRYVISQHARALSKEELRRDILPSNYHSIAQVWYLFSKLTGSRDKRDAEYFRTTYPEFSIGKLAAAKVSNLRIHEVDEKFYYTFQIRKLSSNMKVNVKDRVLLIPNHKRDMKSNRGMESWKVIISDMEWNSKINGYYIKTDLKRKKLLTKPDYPKNPEQLQWYLYKTAMDVWSDKLFKKNGLLQRYNFGVTWLGARLSYLWKIRSKQELKWPLKWSFMAPSVYLFAPELLSFDEDKDLNYLDDNLLSPIKPTPDPSQKKAINLALNNTISGIQGPPGTGKSQTIAALIDEYCIRREKEGNKSVKILVSAFSYAAMRVLIEKIQTSTNQDGSPTKASQLQMLIVRSIYKEKIKGIDNLVRYKGGKKQTWKINEVNSSCTETIPLDSPEGKYKDSYIIFANAYQLYHLPERVDEETFAFDLICVDEASQSPVDNFMSLLQFINKNQQFKIINPKPTQKAGTRVKEKEDVNNLILANKVDKEALTKVVIVGDFNQLPPVQPVPPPKNLEKILESLFAYYVKYHKIPNTQLQVNYRSHKDIVGFTERLGIYHDLIPFPETAERTLEGNLSAVKEVWVQTVLDPTKVVATLIHKRKFEIGVSLLESEIVTKLIIGFFKMRNPTSEDEERKFWEKDIGVVAPHNAQGRLIIRRVFDELSNPSKPQTTLSNSELMSLLKATIYSVEKFQGSDRELIISSIGISDRDQLNAESEFIYNQNRFNVLTSRAKCKVILIASKKFLKYVPEERTIMEEAAQIHKYAYNYCAKSQDLIIKNEENKEESIEFRYKE